MKYIWNWKLPERQPASKAISGEASAKKMKKKKLNKQYKEKMKAKSKKLKLVKALWK